MGMNMKEAKELLAQHGIYQLNKGESLKDALNHVLEGTLRVGYKVKHDDGRSMDKNQIIMTENKAAFARSFTPAEYHEDFVEEIDDVTSENDLREDRTKRGMMVNCYYCGDVIRIDGEGKDYQRTIPEDHCSDCTNDAIMNLCM